MTDVETQEQSIQPSRARGGVEPEKHTAEHPEKYAEEHPADRAEEYPQYPEEHANEALLRPGNSMRTESANVKQTGRK